MDFLSFNQLTLPEKASLINKEGIFLLSREKYLLKIDLYSVDNFFIEVWLTNNEFPKDITIEIIGFDCKNLSATYLDALELKDGGVIYSQVKKNN